MIERALIVPFSKESGAPLESEIKELWPAKRKAIKIFPDWNTTSYKFKIFSTQNINELTIILNKFELIPLKIVNDKDGLYEYQSEKLTTGKFLGFNLGLLELTLFNGTQHYSLSTLNNKQGLLTNDDISYIYESVAGSDFFSFYTSHYLRANSTSKQVKGDDERKHFWLSIAIASELLGEVGRFLRGQLDFTSRVHRSSQVKKYSRESVIEDRDIHWLMENPNEMFISEFGEIPYLGLKYDIEFISQSVTSTDYDTYENRLIISCLYSIQSTLEELTTDSVDVKYFPHQSVSNILHSTNSLISIINSKLNLLPPYNTKPEFSNKYLDDVRYVRLFGLITKWYSYNDLAYGNESRSPILGITKIFEHYCFIKIIESLKIENFHVDENLLKDLNTAGTVIMKREEETISIYYEPTVSFSEFLPLKCSKAINFYTPDIVLIYENKTDMKCGVIDPKFSTQDKVRKELAPEIFYKYGLFFHRPDSKPIDFVYAMYPDVNKQTEVNDHRNREVSLEVTPALGDLSIPFHSDCSKLMAGFLNELITS